MANDSTDELLNAAHHLERALELERRQLFPDLASVRRMSSGLELLEEMLEERCGPVDRRTGLARLVPFRRR